MFSGLMYQILVLGLFLASESVPAILKCFIGDSAAILARTPNSVFIISDLRGILNCSISFAFPTMCFHFHSFQYLIKLIRNLFDKIRLYYHVSWLNISLLSLYLLTLLKNLPIIEAVQIFILMKVSPYSLGSFRKLISYLSLKLSLKSRASPEFQEY
jgi:hypothetical protein